MAIVEKNSHNLDLDTMHAARTEQLGPVPTITFKGQTFELPAEMPFSIVEGVRQMQDAQKNDDGLLISEIVAEIAEALLQERYEEFVAMRPSMSDMQVILENVTRLYGMTPGESVASEG